MRVPYQTSMFGRIHRGRKIDLSCPACGHLQREPALVVSTFCRNCGEYFRVRKGVAIPNPGLKVSGIAEVKPLLRRFAEGGGPAPEEAPVGSSWLVSAEDKEAGPRPIERPAETEPEEGGISAGAFFGLVSGIPAEAEAEAEGPGQPSIGREAQSRETLGQGSMAALIGARETVVLAEKERMPPNFAPPEARRSREESAVLVPVRCFRCYHVQDVSRHAKSTQCGRCSAYISLADYEIKTGKSHTLRTRGDIVIARRGGLVGGCEIACRHLAVNGAIDAIVDCSGDATFRRSGSARGHLYCDKLLIEKGCVVRFPDGVMAKRAEIAGHLVGSLTCSGKVRIGRHGVVEGDLAAVELELKDGARVTGETKIDPATSTAPPLRKGFNPSVIG